MNGRYWTEVAALRQKDVPVVSFTSETSTEDKIEVNHHIKNRYPWCLPYIVCSRPIFRAPDQQASLHYPRETVHGRLHETTHEAIPTWRVKQTRCWRGTSGLVESDVPHFSHPTISLRHTVSPSGVMTFVQITKNWAFFGHDFLTSPSWHSQQQQPHC